MWNPFKPRAPAGAPIQNMGVVDFTGKRRDGGVDLFIVASSRLTRAPEHQKLLLDKIEAYLRDINTPEFKADFSVSPADPVRIVVTCTESPDPVIVELIAKCQPWVAADHVSLVLDIRVPRIADTLRRLYYRWRYTGAARG